jgi:nicotinate-nucleotide adenylyltransferase
MIARLPPSAGLRIGLLGGSFNPPHAAHRAVSLMAMKKLRLDFVWWVVSPGNPLKDTRGLPPLAARIQAAREVASHPRIVVSDLEAQIGKRYTVDTLRYLRTHCPAARFVWVAGADVLEEFHRWRQWRDIFHLIPLCFVDRGGETLDALGAPAALTFARARWPESRAARIPGMRPPAWVFLRGLKSTLSSTAIRTGNARTHVI